MKTRYDVIIIGAGSMGSAAGCFLAKAGANVLMLDAHDPPHTYGSHGGQTRLIRHAYGEGRAYTPLALRSQQLWNDLEKETDQLIFKQTGILGFGVEDSPFIQEAVASAEEHDLPLDVLDGSDIQKRWPGILFPERGRYAGCYEPESGVLFVENCVRAYHQLAEKHGACILLNSPVEDVQISGNTSQVFTAEQSFTASRLIVCAGAWNGKLAHKLNLNLPLQPKRQVTGWFEAQESLFNENKFPGFFADMPSGTFYGFPSINGSGVKIGRHDYGQEVDPDGAHREFGVYPEDEGNVRRFLETWMPDAAGRLKKGITCFYTMTPDGHFIIDRHPEQEHILIAAGFSGHGFKFASGIGEILSDLALKGRTESDISLFSIDRAALK